MFAGAQGATALRAEGCGIALTGDEYKVSVTGFAFSVIGLDWHPADWIAALATPYPVPPDFPRKRGQNKALKSSPFISSSQHNGALLYPVEVLHRTSKWGELRRLACPLRRFPFVAPPNCGGGKGTGFIGEL